VKFQQTSVEVVWVPEMFLAVVILSKDKDDDNGLHLVMNTVSV
jgi:hypothetical protein